MNILKQIKIFLKFILGINVYPKDSDGESFENEVMSKLPNFLPFLERYLLEILYKVNSNHQNVLCLAVL